MLWSYVVTIFFTFVLDAWNDVFSNAWNDDVSYVSGFHAACLTGNLVKITVFCDVLIISMYEIICMYFIGNHVCFLSIHVNFLSAFGILNERRKLQWTFMFSFLNDRHLHFFPIFIICEHPYLLN